MLRLLIRIATAGIAIGLAVMLITVGVVKGYQREVQHKLTGFASPIEVFDPASFSSPESYPVVTDKAIRDLVSQTPGVQRVQRVSEKMGIFKTKDDFAGMMLKGVAQDYDLSFMRSQLVEGELPEFRDDRSSNSIVISRMMAKQLGLKVGDRIYSYYFSDVVKQRRFKVAGIYETHLHQFDKTFVLTDLYTVNRLNNWLPEQSSGLGCIFILTTSCPQYKLCWPKSSITVPTVTADRTGSSVLISILVLPPYWLGSKCLT